MKLVTKWCKGCGKIMRDVQPSKRHCESCLREKDRRYAEANYQRRRARPVGSRTETARRSGSEAGTGNGRTGCGNRRFKNFV